MSSSTERHSAPLSRQSAFAQVDLPLQILPQMRITSAMASFLLSFRKEGPFSARKRAPCALSAAGKGP